MIVISISGEVNEVELKHFDSITSSFKRCSCFICFVLLHYLSFVLVLVSLLRYKDGQGIDCSGRR